MHALAHAIVPQTLSLLHVGCGPACPERLPAYFQQPQWREIRFDIDVEVAPDIIGSITDMSTITDGSIDAIWSSHNLEHLMGFEVPLALAEFHRVLKPDGFALISVPDLRAIANNILEDRLNETIYQSAAGPITPLDVLFGHQHSLQHGNHYMAHRTGFTSSTLGQALSDAGFDEVRVHEGSNWDLWAIASMPQTRSEVFGNLAGVIR